MTNIKPAESRVNNYSRNRQQTKMNPEQQDSSSAFRIKNVAQSSVAGRVLGNRQGMKKEERSE